MSRPLTTVPLREFSVYDLDGPIEDVIKRLTYLRQKAREAGAVIGSVSLSISCVGDAGYELWMSYSRPETPQETKDRKAAMAVDRDRQRAQDLEQLKLLKAKYEGK